ncbi:MAG: hypothetical protein AABW89_01725 [Nanoarchaeota archaeon]
MVIGLKRKGDVTISTIILIVLGLVVLVMLIIGFTKGFDFFFGLFDRGPSELQTLAEACVLYARGDLSIDFCKYNLVEFDGDDELVNCVDGRISSVLTEKGVKSLNCPDLRDAESNACKNLVSKSKWSNVKISDRTCEDIIKGTTDSSNQPQGPPIAPK